MPGGHRPLDQANRVELQVCVSRHLISTFIIAIYY